MSKIVLMIPPLSGEGIYNIDNIRRRPFDYVMVNNLRAILQEEFDLEFFDFDLDGCFSSKDYNNIINFVDICIIFITEGHSDQIIEKYMNCTTEYIIIGPGTKKYCNKKATIIVGEVEFTIKNILMDVMNKKGVYRKKTYINTLGDLDSLPNADHSNINKLISRGGYPSVLISRGCNQVCTFCRSNDFYMLGYKKYRKRKISNIMSEIKEIKKINSYKDCIIHLECESIATGTADTYVYNLLDNIKNENIKYSTFCNVQALTDHKFTQKLSESGCKFVFIGIENSNDNILINFKKNHTYNDIRTAIDNLISAKIQYGIGYLPFNPYTTKKTIYNDITFLEAITKNEFSHPLNICSFNNVCTMNNKYYFELSIFNLFLEFNKIYTTEITPKLNYWENTLNIYPERYTSKKIIFENKKFFGLLKSLCMENLYIDNIMIYRLQRSDVYFLHTLMNDRTIVSSLNIVETQPKKCMEIIDKWNKLKDKENYIIYYKDIPVGWVGIDKLGNNCANIKGIVISPKYQNIGIATYALKEILKSLNLRNYCYIETYVDSSNSVAINLYKKYGFKIIDCVKRTMPNNKTINYFKMSNK